MYRPENVVVRRWTLGVVVMLFIFAAPVVADVVIVKYRGPVDLKPFQCHSVTRSSLVNRVCYDRREQYMVVRLTGTYYHYCEIDPSTVSRFLDADSMGRFFNTNIKGRFDCRVLRVPAYKGR
jgi:hypothetical protein